MSFIDLTLITFSLRLLCFSSTSLGTVQLGEELLRRRGRQIRRFETARLFRQLDVRRQASIEVGRRNQRTVAECASSHGQGPEITKERGHNNEEYGRDRDRDLVCSLFLLLNVFIYILDSK